MVKTSLVRSALLAGLIAGLLAMPTPALAGGGASAVIADCNAHSRLTVHYPAAALRQALSTMPADVKEYTDCYDVIQRTLLTQLGSGHASSAAHSSGSGGSFFTAPVIVVIVLLCLTATGFGLAALRRRGA